MIQFLTDTLQSFLDFVKPVKYELVSAKLRHPMGVDVIYKADGVQYSCCYGLGVNHLPIRLMEHMNCWWDNALAKSKAKGSRGN